MTEARTIADLIVATLEASGVRRVYGLPGDSINGFTDPEAIFTGARDAS